MSWDDFEEKGSGVLGGNVIPFGDEEAFRDGFLNASLREEDPVFRPIKVDMRITKERVIRKVAASNNVLVLGLDQPRIIRVNRDRNEVDDIEVSRRNEERIKNIFLDPTGNHCLIVMTHPEAYYLHSQQKKPRLISKLKAVSIESVAWDLGNTSENSTREFLVGTTQGQIYEVVLETNKEKTKLVYTMSDNSPITGLGFERFPPASNQDQRLFVMATTPFRYYQFVGGPTFEAMFASYTINPGFTELPGELAYSELHFFSKFFPGRSQSFAWLTGPGIYSGQLLFGSQNVGDSVVTNASLFPYPPSDDGSPGRAPVSIGVTEFHFLLVYPDRFVAVSRLSDDKVFEWAPTQKYIGTLLGISRDLMRQTIWLYTDLALFEIAVRDEDRNVWKLHLEKGQFESALNFCKDNAQRDRVWTAQADHFFGNSQFELAATFYAKTQRQFEEVALKFVNARERDALKTYLLHKMEHLRKNDATQLTAISTWLTEIYLDKLNALASQAAITAGGSGGNSAAGAAGAARHSSSASLNTTPVDPEGPYARMLEEFKQFLSDNKNHLNPATTFHLISSHGRIDELLFYANLVEDHELIISHFIQCQQYEKALKVLEKLSGHHAEIFYKFSPVLMHHAPWNTVNTWMSATFLEPQKLLPALMRYDESRNPPGEHINQAIRYLEYVINRLHNTDPAIHNYLISLYAKQSDSSALLAFLGADGKHRETHFDLKYALRLCARMGKVSACVHIYTAMGLFEEAVELALTVDLELAKSIAERIDTEEDRDLRKKLWLRIARHVVEVQKDIKKAMGFLSTDLLHIEDILPFFPESVLIQDFKDEICKALEDYNENIEALKREMEEATHSADLIRQDIKELRNRYAFVRVNQNCDLCGTPVLSRHFYLFPCQHAFHGDCLLDEVIRSLSNAQKAHIKDLERRLAEARLLPAGPAPGTVGASGLGNSGMLGATSSSSGSGADSKDLVNFNISPTDKIRSEIDDIIAHECLFCGDIMIKSIDIPFVNTKDEKQVIESWRI